MKTIPIISLLILGCIASLRADLTAYQALERLESLRGSEALENIIAIRSYDAKPGTSEWVVSRRLGSKFQPAEIVSSTGSPRRGDVALAAQDLPLHAERLRFSMLNMDSDAALRIARKQIGGFRYDFVDYSLFMYPLAGTPAWTLSFYNPEKQRMARLTISGTTGATLRPVEYLVYELSDSTRPATVATFQEPFHERALRSIGNWFSRTGSIFGQDSLRALSTTEEILVGDRTRDDATAQ
jgi:hypothetical protein